MVRDGGKNTGGRVTPAQLYMITPKTNCGECGYASCLAFATQAVVGQARLDLCPYLDEEKLSPIRLKLEDQLSRGIGVKREGFQKALDYLKEEIKKWSFREIASSLGAEFRVVGGEDALELEYFDKKIMVTRRDIFQVPSGEIDPWEKIFIYNYVIGGAAEPSGEWVGMESLPNSVSKIKSLRAHCEEPLAEAFAGKMDLLPEVVKEVGGVVKETEAHVDLSADFQVLPKLTIRILWWDEEPEEGFEAKTKFLFDSRVLDILDIESLLFACEQLTERLLDALKKRSKGP